MRDEFKEPINWRYYRNFIQRHTWDFLLPFFLGWLIVWAATWLMPSVYRSGTLILVEEPTVPQEFVISNVAGDLQSRLQSITQQILSRTRLLKIIDHLNLYPDYREHSSPDDLVDRMRKDIKIELNRSEDGRALTSFNVYYSAQNPATAQAATSELCNLFINENLEVRQQQSKATTDFLQGQLDSASRELAEQELKLKEFKGKHLGELPSQMQANLQILAGLQAQLQSEQDALTRARQQDGYLQSMLNQYRTLQNRSGGDNGAALDVPTVADELERSNEQMAELRALYTEKHPDIRKLKSQIAQTERMKAQIEADASKRQDKLKTLKSATQADARSPIFQIENQLTANSFEISNHQNTVQQLRARIAEYQAKLDVEPVREQQLADVTRGYEQSRADYDSLLKRKNESELATNLELQQRGEHFRVLDPPNLPIKPYSPQRMKLFVIGLVVGATLGIALTASKELTNDRIFSERELEKLVPVKVIAEIPPVLGPCEEHEQSRQRFYRWASAGAVLTSVLAALAFTYYRG